MKHGKLLGLLALFAACGGGGGGTALQTAAMRGVVYELDGQTLDRSGVLVTVMENGSSQLTGPDGRFSFDSLPAGTLTLQFGSSLVVAAQESEGEAEEGDGEEGEEHDGEEHDGEEHDGEEHDGEEHDGEEHDGEEHDGEEHDGEEHDGEEHDGEEHDGEEHDGEEHDGEEHEADGEGEHEHADEDGEGEEGEWHVAGVAHREEVEVRVALRDGKVIEFRLLARDRLRAESRLHRAEASPDEDVAGKVRVESRREGDRFAIAVEQVAPSAGLEFFLDDPETEAGPVSIGTATSGAGGGAEFVRESGGAPGLPLGVRTVRELAGFRVHVRLLATGQLLLVGEVPGLPDTGADSGMPPREGQDARGRSLLRSEQPELEGYVEIRSRPEQHRQLFLLQAEGFVPGTQVSIQIEDPAGSGLFVTLVTRLANGDGGVALEMSSPLPLGVERVADLVGRKIRLIDAGGSGEVLLAGSVPPLVAE